jgi:hypothetical protein
LDGARPDESPALARDFDAVHAVSVAAFDDLGRRLGLEDNPPSPLAEDVGLDLRFDIGAVFMAGDVGPFAPYLPSGAYL